MNQFYNRINNNRFPLNDHLLQCYQSILNQGFPAGQLPDASHLPRQAPVVVDYLIFQLTDVHINADNFSSALRELQYPLYQRFDGRELNEQMWPELLGVIDYLLSIFDFKAPQRDYTDEFPKLAAMREDYVLQEYQVLDDPEALNAVQSAYESKCKLYLDKVQQDIELIRQDLETLEQEYAQKASEPLLREKIKDAATIVEMDMHMLKDYTLNANSKFNEVETNLKITTEKLETAQGTLAQLETHRRKIESLLESSGTGLADLLSESNTVKILEDDLQDSQQKLQKYRSTQDNLKAQFAKSCLPIQQQLLSFNHTYGVELPTQLNSKNLPELDIFSDLDHKIQLESRNLNLEYLKVKADTNTLQDELDADHRKLLLLQDTKERLEAKVTHKSEELQRLVTNPKQQQNLEFAKREESKNGHKQKRDQLLSVQAQISEALQEHEQHTRQLERQVSSTIQPLCESVEQKRNQLTRIYDELQAGVNSLQTYANEYLDVCDQMREDVEAIHPPKPRELRVSVDLLNSKVEHALSSRLE